MLVEPYITESASAVQSCMNICQADPNCAYYLFAHKSKSCILYSQPDKECSGYLGIPKMALRECVKSSNHTKSSKGNILF